MWNFLAGVYLGSENFFRFRLQTNRRHRKKAKIACFVLFIYIFLFPTSSRRTGLDANVLVDVIIIWFHRLVFVCLVYVSAVLPMRKLFHFFDVVVGNLDYRYMLLFLCFEAHLTMTRFCLDGLSEGWNSGNGRKGLVLARQRMKLDLKKIATKRWAQRDLGSDQQISSRAKCECFIA